MRIRLLSIAIAVVMISTASGMSVFARTANDTGPSGVETKVSPDKTASTKEKGRETKLKGDMQKLLADAKAGKVAPRPQRLPDGGRHNLSTGAKIGIIAAIAGAIFAIIVIHQVNSD
jgi:hypothetical protein